MPPLSLRDFIEAIHGTKPDTLWFVLQFNLIHIVEFNADKRWEKNSLIYWILKQLIKVVNCGSTV